MVRRDQEGRRPPRPPGIPLVEHVGGDAQHLRQASIAIVGAGAAGIGAARALRRQGYQRVTVLEGSSTVGGKCCTVEHDGRAYELGAGAMTHRYAHVRAWMREAGMHPAPKYSGLYLDPATGKGTFQPPGLARGGLLRAPLHLARMVAALRRLRGIAAPGLCGTPAELHRPTSEVVRELGIEVAAKLAEPFFTGFGYGHYDETPALYFLKYATLFGPVFELLPEGYGGLMRHAAGELDVRLNVHIDRVERMHDRVRIHTPDGSHDFDAVIVASALDGALAYLDATDRERELFSRFVHKPYYAYGARVERFPSARWAFVMDHFHPSHTGAPIFVYRRWGDEGLAFFYGHYREGEEESCLQRVHEATERYGGRVLDVPLRKHWRYFPHVGREDLDDGFYEKVEALQGQRRTYYVGEALAFGTVETSIDYADDLVGRFFVPA
jgi:hypothetical protein